MHQVQLAVTQMFDGVTQVLGEDIPLRRGFGCRRRRQGDAEAVAVGNRSGAVRSAGSGPMASSMPRSVSIGNQQRTSLHTFKHSQTVQQVYSRAIERSNDCNAVQESQLTSHLPRATQTVAVLPFPDYVQIKPNREKVQPPHTWQKSCRYAASKCETHTRYDVLLL